MHKENASTKSLNNIIIALIILCLAVVDLGALLFGNVIRSIFHNKTNVNLKDYK